jgi:hypothetical protein
VPARIASWSSEIEAITGTSVVLDCMRFGQPNPTLSWENGYGEALNFNDRVSAKDDGSLVISELRRADTGQYTCSVANTHGSDSITHTLMVKGE